MVNIFVHVINRLVKVNTTWPIGYINTLWYSSWSTHMNRIVPGLVETLPPESVDLVYHYERQYVRSND